MAREELKSANDGINSRIFLPTWGISQKILRLNERTITVIMNQAIVSGQHIQNRQIIAVIVSGTLRSPDMEFLHNHAEHEKLLARDGQLHEHIVIDKEDWIAARKLDHDFKVMRKDRDELLMENKRIKNVWENALLETPILAHILRNWERSKIVQFALHLLGDECQKCWERKSS